MTCMTLRTAQFTPQAANLPVLGVLNASHVHRTEQSELPILIVITNASVVTN